MLDWTQPDLTAVTLTVHQHLRHSPVVQSARGAYRAVVTQEPWAPEAFRQPLSLYYLQQGGTPVRLCPGPGQAMEVEQAALVGAPVLTAYTPAK